MFGVACVIALLSGDKLSLLQPIHLQRHALLLKRYYFSKEQLLSETMVKRKSQNEVIPSALMPQRNTCSVAKKKKMSDFIRQKHVNKLSLKMAALKGLCLMTEESKWSVECFVCKQRIWSNKALSYDWKNIITQDSNAGKYLVNIIRRHCRREHPLTIIWNVIPEMRYREDLDMDPGEYLIHQAMRAGGSTGFVPTEPTQLNFAIALSMRIAQSIAWLRWNKMATKTVNRLGGMSALVKATEEKLNNLFEIALARIKSTLFIDSLASHTLEQMYNKLMLFFFETGRYQTCPIFSALGEVEQGNELVI